MTTEKQKKKNTRLLYFRMPKYADGWILGATIALAIYGTAMIASASMGLEVGDNGYLLKTVLKQVAFVVFGYALMVQLANQFKISFVKSRGLSNWLIIVFGLLLACRLFVPTGSSYAWIRIPVPGMEVTLQPSELAKILAILAVAGYCGDVTKTFEKDWTFLKKPVLIIVSMVALVLVYQHDLGSAMVIFFVSCVCALMPQHPNMRKLRIALKILFWLAVAGVIIFISPVGETLVDKLPIEAYQKARFMAVFNPFGDYYNTTYQLANGLVAFATGGWFGLGFGNSIRKYTHFAAANTDYILSILVEELGFVGFLFLLALYCIILYRLLDYARQIKSERAKIILVGTAMYLLVHMIFNIGGVTGLLPLTGVPLLMISAGGSSTLAFMAAIGISEAVISRYRRGDIR